MNRVTLFLNNVNLLQVLFAVFVLSVMWLLIPPKHRTAVVTAGTLCWIAMGALITSPVFAVAKATAPLAYLFLLLTAMADPRPKSNGAPVLWLYIIAAVIWLIAISRSGNVAQSAALQINWLLIVLAAIRISVTIRTEEDLLDFIKILAYGLGFLMLYFMFWVLSNPGRVFVGGVNRVSIMGGNPNQYGPVLVMAVWLNFLSLMFSRSTFQKTMAITSISIGLLLGLLTGSRSILYIILLPAIPILLRGGSRKFWVFPIVVGVFLLTMFTSDFFRGQLDRVQSIDEGRFYIAWEYVKLSLESPLLGIFFRPGWSSLQAPPGLGLHHPHNAYIWVLYVGGLMLAVPLYIVVFLTIKGSWFLSRQAHLFNNPLIFKMLFFVVLGMYLQGFGNQVLYYSTNAWALFHVICSCLVLNFAFWYRTAPVPQAQGMRLSPA